MKIFIIILGLLLYPLIAQAHFADHEKWAQMTKEQQQWLMNQHVPGGDSRGGSCCNQNDGEEVQQDIRDGHYWVKGSMREGDELREKGPTLYQQYIRDGNLINKMDNDGWILVPDEVVINEPNKYGRAVVWWYPPATRKQSDNDDGRIQIEVRCFAPGELY